MLGFTQAFSSFGPPMSVLARHTNTRGRFLIAEARGLKAGTDADDAGARGETEIFTRR